MKKNYYDRLIEENFGQPLAIGDFAGQRLDGVRGTSYDERDGAVCSGCGELPIDGTCGCDHGDVMTCPHCQEMPISNSCGCGMMNEKKGMESCSECGLSEAMCQCGMSEVKGPSKKTAKKILRGTKTFKEKMKKVSNWADDPAAAAAWMMHKATGKWPSEK